MIAYQLKSHPDYRREASGLRGKGGVGFGGAPSFFPSCAIIHCLCLMWVGEGRFLCLGAPVRETSCRGFLIGTLEPQSEF